MQLESDQRVPLESDHSVTFESDQRVKWESDNRESIQHYWSLKVKVVERAWLKVSSLLLGLKEEPQCEDKGGVRG